MNTRGAQLSLTAIALLIGFLLVAQMNSLPGIGRAQAEQLGTDRTTIICSLVESNAALRAEVEALQARLAAYEEDTGGGMLQSLVDELNRIRIVNGLVAVSGPGVRVVVDAPISVLDMQDLVNELRNAGAEALALNDQRLVVFSVVNTDGSGGLLVNDTRVLPPYVLSAIGSPNTLETALLRKGGIVEALRETYGPQAVRVERETHLVLPIYPRPVIFRYARVDETQ